MFNKNVVCLELGSSKLRVIVASSGVNDTLIVKELASRAYEGYYQGEFVDIAHLAPNLYELFNSIDFKKKKYNKKLYVALPSEFGKVSFVSASVDVGSNLKVDKTDVSTLISQALSKAEVEDGEVVSISPISYYVDEMPTSQPIGKKGRLISGEFSVVSSERSLIQKLNTIISEIGFSSVEYICEALCTASFLTPEEEKCEGAVIIDVGHLSTSVAQIKGGGLSFLTSFSIGGGHITSDLAEAFDLPYQVAENLKKQLVISVDADPLDVTDISSVDGKIERIPTADAIKVVKFRLETIASAINQCLSIHGITGSNFMSVYLIGSAVSLIKGGRDFLSKCLGRNIAFGGAPLPGKESPSDAVIYSIAAWVLKNCEN